MADIRELIFQKNGSDKVTAGIYTDSDGIVSGIPAALKKAEEDKAQVTDDCSAVERLGMKIKIVEGDERNLKVTTPLDLKIAELLLEETK